MIVGAVATAFEVGMTPQFVHFRNFKVGKVVTSALCQPVKPKEQGVVILWLAAESVTDVIITGTLVWYL
jgi:hypothetical protein